jgi:hypothetical protein
LDGDGEYDDAAGPEAVVPGTTLAGPATLTISAAAENAQGTRTREYVVPIRNVAPDIELFPLDQSVALVTPYQTQLVARDHRLDEVLFAGQSLPAGMRIADTSSVEDGVWRVTTANVRWEPSFSDAGRSHPVTFVASDGDGGNTPVSWVLTTRRNERPSAPTIREPMDFAVVPEQPVLITTNSIDPERQSLSYRFRVGRSADLDADAWVTSDRIDEGNSGTTEWPVIVPLEPGIWFWEVWAYDGVTESPHAFATMTVAEPEPEIPQVPDPPPLACECRTAAGSSRAHAHLWAMIAIALAVWRRRCR